MRQATMPCHPTYKCNHISLEQGIFVWILFAFLKNFSSDQLHTCWFAAEDERSCGFGCGAVWTQETFNIHRKTGGEILSFCQQ